MGFFLAFVRNVVLILACIGVVAIFAEVLVPGILKGFLMWSLRGVNLGWWFVVLGVLLFFAFPRRDR